VQHLGGARADQSQAEQVALVSINHHARPTGVPVCVKLGSHDDIADFHIHCAHPVTRLRGLLSCQSHGGGFGIGT
jgi:hypothetical protein